MEKQLRTVEQFQTLIGEQKPSEPQPIPQNNETTLRYELMREENEEYLAAIKDQDLVEVADALADMLYILCGTILEHGMDSVILDVFEEVHRSNMSKQQKDGTILRRLDGKILKGENYFKPNIKKILNQWKQRQQ